MSRYQYPAKHLIGRTIRLNVSGDEPGAAYDETRRRGFTTTIEDAGNMTGGPVIWIITVAGIGFLTDQYDDYVIDYVVE